MTTPDVVAANVRAMQAAVDIPVTIKCRIGVDEQEPREALWALVDACADAGCSTFLVHARKAWLKGLSPKQNRDVPPLDYELVYLLKQEFPQLEIVLNGGISSIADCLIHLEHVDGVMMGREAYSNPYIMSHVHAQLYEDDSLVLSRDNVLECFIEYAQERLDDGARLNHLTRHIVGLFHGEPRSRLWRRYLSEHAHKAGSGVEVMRDAYQSMLNG